MLIQKTHLCNSSSLLESYSILVNPLLECVLQQTNKEMAFWRMENGIFDGQTYIGQRHVDTRRVLKVEWKKNTNGNADHYQV